MNLELGYSLKILFMFSRTAKVSFLNVDLPLLNRIVLAYSFSFLITSSVTSGHPLLATVPLTSGQRSSLSSTVSPSVSGHGHPPFSLGPLTSGHLSDLSAIPSPSASGQPCRLARPATS